jgi:hypothetical protein
VNALLNQVYALEPTLRAPISTRPRWTSCCACASARSSVILTNLRDEDDDTLMPALALLRQRHLVMVASLRETILDRRCASRSRALDDALTHAATAEYLERRRAAFRSSRRGVPVPGRRARRLAIDAGEPLLELKRSGRM